MIKVGQKVRYDPFAEEFGMGICDCRQEVTGTVKYINKKHHWFSVVDDNSKLRTSYHFCHIGRDVKVCG